MIIESSTIAAASLLRPYISEQNYWVLQHHEVKLNKLIMLMRKRQMEVMVVLAFNFCITVHLKSRWHQIPFLDFPDPILLLIIIMITIKLIIIMIIIPAVDLPDPVLWESLWGWPQPEGSLQAWNQLTTLELGNIWQSLFFGILGLPSSGRVPIFQRANNSAGTGIWPPLTPNTQTCSLTSRTKLAMPTMFSLNQRMIFS